ncbi:electron transfer flavoprotein beta subunit lysine methyltransferase isoform X1 [Anopheles gambiae]|uniref:electron transfer flavoprotein beta subunit lysine methyltransferase isoform X1 n=1 Tax=Anopheles gambiae TaxID=7165 RepID=UPI002AC8DA22|nr:electron transfer flavoprotein beta subunit lysine methyltransferase isoform X1 [Anopheles gambiae]
MSQIARHASRRQMNGAGLVDVVVRGWQRTFHTNTAAAVKFRTTDAVSAAHGGITNTTSNHRWNLRRYSRTTDRYDDGGSGGGFESSRVAPGKPSDATGQNRNAPSTTLYANSGGKDSDVISVRGKILSNTVLSRQHMTPEIALHLITPDCAIYHQPVGAGHHNSDNSGADTGFSADPFWGFFWPGGQALTRFILDTGHVFRGKTVLEVGCGCGASAIAALLVGATRVIANDIDPVALQATLLNAERNGITGNRLVVSSDNLIGQGADETHQTVDRCEVVLIGDLFYDTEIAADLHPWIQRLARAGAEIYIGDPGRHGITETGVLSQMELRARYELPANVCLENSGFSHANVWQFRLPSDEA